MYLHRHSFKQNEFVLYRVFYPFPNVIPEQAFVPDVARVTTAGSDRIRLSSPGGSPDRGIGTPVLSKIIEDLKELGFMWVLSINIYSVSKRRKIYALQRESKVFYYKLN